MKLSSIAGVRLRNQQLLETKYDAVDTLVGWMGAMQAQDYNMAKWGIGLRLNSATDKLIEDAIQRGQIIRTHILRPTWHFVTASDLRWIMELTAPHVNRLAGTMYRQLELDDRTFKKTNRIIERILRDRTELTREEIMVFINKAGIPTNSLRAMHIMFRAELDLVVCNGKKKGNQFTYALVDEKVPPGKKLKRDEAIVALTQRYFQSRGPATLEDLRWWSGLPMKDVKMGLHEVNSALNSASIGSKEYWWHEPAPQHAGKNTILFLPSYDEFNIAYRDRSAAFEDSEAMKKKLGNGIFKPSIIFNGVLVGTWKKSEKKDHIVIETTMLQSLKRTAKREFTTAANRLGEFLNKPIVLK